VVGFEADEEGSEDNEEEFKEESDCDEIESEDEAFVTPKALRRSWMIPTKSDLSDMSDTLDAEVGRTNVRNLAQESNCRADIQPEKRMNSGNMNQSTTNLGFQMPKHIDLSKAQRNETQSKEKRAFHKEVEARRVVVVKETANKVRLIVY
jgi:hypothetical protein